MDERYYVCLFIFIKKFKLQKFKTLNISIAPFYNNQAYSSNGFYMPELSQTQFYIGN